MKQVRLGNIAYYLKDLKQALGGVEENGCLSFANDYCTGTCKHIETKPGFNVLIQEFNVAKVIDFKVTAVEKNEFITFGFIKSGNYSLGLSDNQLVFGDGADNACFYNVEGSIYFKANPQKELKFLGIQVSRELLKRFDSETFKQLDELLKVNHPFFYTEKITPELQLIIDEIFMLEEHVIGKKAIYLAKCHELAGRFVSFLIGKYDHSRFSLRFSEIEIINRVKERVVESLDNPPSLDDLSREFGISRSKLTHNFKLVLGTSIKSYFNKFRLNEARIKLKNTDDTISQIGFDIGYTNLSKFSAAFKNEFGCTPGEFKGG